jgi:hypothetical protein
MVWSINDQRWDRLYGELLAFKNEFGHVDVPIGSKAKEYKKWRKLANWLNEQRALFKEESLPAERAERLTRIGVSLNRKRDDKWIRGVSAYRKYVEDTGNVNPNRSVVVNGVRLGVLLTDYRVRNAEGTLSPERVAELESIGIDWSPPNGNIERGFELLKVFKRREGHVMVPDNWIEDGFALGVWLTNRRAFKKRGTILAEHERELERLGVVWSVNDFKWDRRVSAVRDFLKDHRLSEVVRGVHHNGVNIGSWRNNAMHSYRQGKLSKKQITDLVSLGLVDPTR